MTDIQVIENTIQTNLVMKKVSILGVAVTPFTSANIHLALHYEEQNPTILSPSENCKCTTVFMPTEDYLKWQNDDSYLVDFVLSKLGLTKSK